MASQLDKDYVERTFADGIFPGGVHVFETIDSTNDWSLAEIKRRRELPFVCIAEHQTRGRGRRGRHWLSPAGANIYMSLAWHFDLAADRLCLLSLAQGVAVIRALSQVGVNGAWLKWPNDVFVKDEKIAGVLIETSGAGASSCKTVIGVGLNYCMPEGVTAGSAIRWTDIAHAIKSRLPDRNVVFAALLHQMIDMCGLYQQKGTAIYTDLAHEFDALAGKNVRINTEQGDPINGKVLGVNPAGALRVLVAEQEQIFNSADVSLSVREACIDVGTGHDDN